MSSTPLYWIRFIISQFLCPAHHMSTTKSLTRDHVTCYHGSVDRFEFPHDNVQTLIISVWSVITHTPNNYILITFKYITITSVTLYRDPNEIFILLDKCHKWNKTVITHSHSLQLTSYYLPSEKMQGCKKVKYITAQQYSTVCTLYVISVHTTPPLKSLVFHSAYYSNVITSWSCMLAGNNYTTNVLVCVESVEMMRLCEVIYTTIVVLTFGWYCTLFHVHQRI